VEPADRADSLPAAIARQCIFRDAPALQIREYSPIWKVAVAGSTTSTGRRRRAAAVSVRRVAGLSVVAVGVLQALHVPCAPLNVNH
jgi:hypothetical protein